MTINELKNIIKESIEEVLDETSCPICGEAVFISGKKCECIEEKEEENT